MELFFDLLAFSLKALILVISILMTVAGIIAISAKCKGKDKGKLQIDKLNENYTSMQRSIEKITLPKKELKEKLKADKQLKKKSTPRNRIFLINFKGDIKATSVESLRNEITSILQVSKPTDEVVLKLESPGGVPHGYGLAASQLSRLREQHIPLTICIDKVAASGGYMMACVANKILAAPFSIIGSIGVIAQMPNFHRFLNKHDIDFEQHSAGEYKRTITLFGEITDKDRKKFKEEIEEIHFFFKEHIKTYRPQVDINKVATGEYWLGSKALELNLVDQVSTSDNYLFEKQKDTDIIQVQYLIKKPLGSKLTESVSEIKNAFTELNTSQFLM